MKEISVESVDELRIGEEQNSPEIFRNYWAWFEALIWVLNLVMYALTLGVHYEYFSEFSHFMIVYTLFLLLNVLICMVTEILWFILKLISYSLCCPIDETNQTSNALYVAIGYFSKKAILFSTIGFALFNLRKYLDSGRPLVNFFHIIVYKKLDYRRFHCTDRILYSLDFGRPMVQFVPGPRPKEK
jgi:hypothetical protein